jgi:hypothetical protein
LCSETRPERQEHSKSHDGATARRHDATGRWQDSTKANPWPSSRRAVTPS